MALVGNGYQQSTKPSLVVPEVNCMTSNDSKNIERGKERVTNHCSDDSDTVHKEINIEKVGNDTDTVHKEVKTGKEIKTGKVCCDTDTLKVGSDVSNIEDDNVPDQELTSGQAKGNSTDFDERDPDESIKDRHLHLEATELEQIFGVPPLTKIQMLLSVQRQYTY